MTEHELKKIVSEAVSETLLQLGIDVSNPVEMQKDMAHLRSWRESVATVKQQGLITAVGIVVAGLIGLVYLAFKGSP